jgi:hypothetical protein
MCKKIKDGGEKKAKRSFINGLYAKRKNIYMDEVYKYFKQNIYIAWDI